MSDTTHVSVSAPSSTDVRDERGDIAGWVMITVMTIMLAGAIMAIFTPAVTDYLQTALSQFM
jgi:hypothetical protein